MVEPVGPPAVGKNGTVIDVSGVITEAPVTSASLYVNQIPFHKVVASPSSRSSIMEARVKFELDDWPMELEDDIEELDEATMELEDVIEELDDATMELEDDIEELLIDKP